MKGQFTRDDGGDLWMYIAPHHTGYWKFVDAEDNWVERGMALQVTGNAADLFSAAPELLAALKQMVSEAESLGWDCSHIHPAINKAEGRSE